MNLDEICEVSPDFLNGFYCPVNPQNRITALIREKESSSAYLDEALVLSVPTKMLISRFKKICESNIPFDIASLTIADVDKSGHIKRNIDDNDVKPSNKLIDCIKLRDKDRDVSTLTNFIFAFEDNHKRLNDFITKMTDEFNAIGYNHV